MTLVIALMGKEIPAHREGDLDELATAEESSVVQKEGGRPE